MNTTIVVLGGQERPIKFGFNALTDFSKRTNRNIEQLNTLNPMSLTMEDLLTLCWCALKSGARKEGQEFKVTIEDVGDWLDDNPGALVEITREYQNSRIPDPNHPSVKKNPGTDQSP
jgi:hypothetical protein